MALIECPECGAGISDRAAACPKCGLSMLRALIECPECAAQIPDTAVTCPECGFPLTTAPAHRCTECGEGFESEPDLDSHRETVHRQGWTPSVNIECPHCHVTGQVATRRVRVKEDISGGRATGAVLTGGFSVLATGLSHKKTVTELHCDFCGVTWAI